MSDPQTLSYESPQTTTLTGVALGTIALQVLGVYCIALALPIFTVIASFFGTGGFASGGRPAWQSLFSFALPALYFIVGIGLTRLAPCVSAWLFRDVVGGVMIGKVTTSTGRNLQAIAFSVVGVVTMISAAPRLVSLIWLMFMDMGRAIGIGGYGQFVEPIIQFLFGLALFLQSKGLALLWHRIRTSGVENRADSLRGPEGVD